MFFYAYLNIYEEGMSFAGRKFRCTKKVALVLGNWVLFLSQGPIPPSGRNFNCEAMENKSRQIRIFSVDLLPALFFFLDTHLQPNVLSRYVGDLVLTYLLTLLVYTKIYLSPGLGLQALPQLSHSKASSFHKFPKSTYQSCQILRHPFLNHEPSSTATALVPPFLKTPFNEPHGRLLDALPLVPERGFLRLSLPLREVFALLVLQTLDSGDFCEGYHCSWVQAGSPWLSDIPHWNLWPRPPFFTLESLKDTKPFQMHPLYTKITLCSDSLLSWAGVIYDIIAFVWVGHCVWVAKAYVVNLRSGALWHSLHNPSLLTCFEVPKMIINFGSEVSCSALALLSLSHSRSRT